MCASGIWLLKCLPSPLGTWFAAEKKKHAHLLVGEEVDDGVVDRTGLGKVHGHGGEQRRDVKLWIQDHHHRQGGVGQPADEKSYYHGQDHGNGVIILLPAGPPTLELHTPVQLRAESRFDTVKEPITYLVQSVGGKLQKREMRAEL